MFLYMVLLLAVGILYKNLGDEELSDEFIQEEILFSNLERLSCNSAIL